MKRINVFTAIMLSLFFVCTIVSSAAGQDAGQKVWNLKYYSVFRQNMFEGQVEARFVDSVAKATNGRVIMKPYWSASLMSRKECLQGLLNGVYEIGAFSIPDSPGQFPVSEMAMLPFLFKSSEQALNTFNALYKKGYMPEYNKIKLCTIMMTDMQYMAVTKKAVNRLEDFKGLKIRVAPGISSETIKALGGVPVGMSFSELYMAASRGMIDGFISSSSRFEAVKLNEVADYFLDLPLFVGLRYMGMNLKTWNSFPDDIKAIMEKEFVKVSDDWLKENTIGEENAKKVLKERGMKFISISPSELDRWKQATNSIEAGYIEKLNSRGLQGQRIMDEAKAIIASQ